MADAKFDAIAQAGPLDDMGFTPVLGLDLELRLSAQCTRFSLRLDPKNRAMVEDILGHALPVKIGGMEIEGTQKTLCLGPDEWMLICSHEEEKLLGSKFGKLAQNLSLSLVEITDRLVGIEITGRAAARIISAGCPLDLEILPDGSCARSLLEQVPMVVLKYGADQFRVEIARSHGEYAWNFLVQSARFASA